MKIRVGIADDHIIVLDGLKSILQKYEGIEIVHICVNSKELLNSLVKEQPDVLLLDVQIPDISGDQLTKMIKKKYPKIKILALTNMDSPYYIKNMMYNGASGYLLKNISPKLLTDAIVTVYNGGEYIDRSLLERIEKNELDIGSGGEKPTLTKREQEILELITKEMTSAQIAKKLFLSIGTVENHRTNLFLKLNVKNVVGLVKKGISLGLIK